MDNSSLAPQSVSDPLEEPPGIVRNDAVIAEHKFVGSVIDERDFLSVTAKYPFVSTGYYLSLANPSLDDPVMRQLCPSTEEIDDAYGGVDDPLREEEMSPVPGLVHRYPDRVLMVVTNACFMNCRHCTRKRSWKYGKKPRTLDDIRKMADYVRANTNIRDVIISGGDPLTFSDETLEEIIKEIRSIPHVEIIRIGTRAPVVAPFRITRKLAGMLSTFRPIWINTQFNHAREITPESSEAVRMMLEAGLPVNNQSVLLKGVNDSARDITELCHVLLKIGVRPYYLFHCDPVRGAAHFRTSVSKGTEIISMMQGHTSGLAVPTFVVDAVSGGGKIPLQPQNMVSKMPGKMIIKNYRGQCFIYDDPKVEVLKA